MSSLLAHLEDVRDILKRRKPIILMASETCLSEEINDNEIECERYKCFRNDSHSRHTGGCCVYIRLDYQAEMVNSATMPENVWILSTRVSQTNTNCVVTVLYHSPSASETDFLNYFEDWCEEHLSVTDNNIICGDFNIDFLRRNNYVNRLKCILNESGMKQFVKDPTRVTHLTKTLIDLVCSDVEVSVEVLSDEKISDNSTLIIETSILKDKEYEKKYENRIQNYSAEKMREFLSEYDWNNTLNLNLNEKLVMLNERLKSYDKSVFCPSPPERLNNPALLFLNARYLYSLSFDTRFPLPSLQIANFSDLAAKVRSTLYQYWQENGYQCWINVGPIVILV